MNRKFLSVIGEASVLTAAFAVTVLAFQGLSPDQSLQANILNPTHVQSIVDGTDNAIIKGAQAVAVDGNHAFITSRFSDSLEVFDISEPFSPVKVGSITDGEGGAPLKSPWAVQIDGDFAFVAAKGSDALTIIDVSDPQNPTYVNDIRHGEDSAKLLSPLSVKVQNNIAYVASYISDSLEIIDVSDPQNLIRLGGVQHGEQGAQLNGAADVFVKGDMAYVAAQNANALEIIDVSDPEAPFHIGGLQDDYQLRQIRSIYVEGDYAYLTARSSLAFHIINISDPLVPELVSSVDHGPEGVALNDPRDLVVYNEHAFVVSNRSNALEIINVSEQNAAHTLSIESNSESIPLDSPTSITLANGLLFVTTDGEQGSLEVISPFPNRELVANSENIDLGLVEVTGSDTSTVILSNTGYLPIELTEINLSNDGDFSIEQDTCSANTFEPHTQCSFVARFSPQSIGEKNATVAVISDSAEFSITLTGEGYGEEELPVEVTETGGLETTLQTDLAVKILGVSINYGSGGPAVPVELTTTINETEYDLFYGTEFDVTDDVIFSLEDIAEETTIDVEGTSFHPYYSWNTLFSNGTAEDSQMIIALKNGDSVPELTPYEQQPLVDEMLEDYITPEGVVTIGENDIIYLMELGTNNPANSAADFQDAVMLFTFTTTTE
jgi:hypothetical protein